MRSPWIKAAIGTDVGPRGFQAFMKRPVENRAPGYYGCGQRLLSTSTKGGDDTSGDRQETRGQGIGKVATAGVEGASGIAEDNEQGPVKKVHAYNSV